MGSVEKEKQNKTTDYGYYSPKGIRNANKTFLIGFFLGGIVKGFIYRITADVDTVLLLISKFFDLSSFFIPHLRCSYLKAFI